MKNSTNKPKLFFPLLVLIIFLINCHLNLSAQELINSNVVIGQVDSLYSEILEENREIWVHVPNSQQGDITYGKNKHPVLYLMDGTFNFHTVTGELKHLSASDVCPSMIVVGIIHNDRTSDLTPTHIERSKTSGQGEKFTEFLEKELIPFIDGKYPTRPYRTLVGRSLGGLFVVSTLVHHPDLFNNYIAIDPSLWWDNQILVMQSESVFKERKFKDKSLYLAVANTMPKGMDTTSVVNDTTRRTNHIRSMLDFAKTTNTIHLDGLDFSWKYYRNEGHTSVSLIALYDALHYMFSWYKLSPREITSTPPKAEELLNAISLDFERRSSRLGYVVPPDERLINNLGYRFMNRDSKGAYTFFSLNIKNYPESPNVYDSMGDYYVSQSDTGKAIKFFAKAYELGKNPLTKRKLDELKAEVSK